MASIFKARVCCEKLAVAHVLVPKVLNGLVDPDAAPVQNVAARALTVEVEGQNAAVAVLNVAAPAQNVVEADHYAEEDHFAEAVHNAAADLRVARVPGAKMVAHNCRKGDPVVALGYQVAPGQIARVGPFPRAADFFPGVPAGQFVQADHFFRDARDDLQEFRFRLPAVWWEQLAVVALAATR